MTDEAAPEREGARRMMEEVVVTPFFKRHTSHMPASLKLKAEIIDQPDEIILKSDIRGYTEDEVEVTATPNAIHVTLHTGEKAGEESDEGVFGSDVSMHSAYVTPTPINPDKLTFKHEHGVLTVRAPKADGKLDDKKVRHLKVI